MNEENQPLYLKIYEMLLEEIKSGKYKDGERLPSEKELAEQFDVSRITSKKALELLSSNGFIHRMRGKGSFVRDDSDFQESSNDEDSEVERNGKLIGVIMPDFSESYGMKLFMSIQAEAAKNGCFIIPQFSYGKQELEENAIEELTDLGVVGIIIMPVHGENYNSKLLRLVLDDYPVVLIDRYLKGISAAFAGSDNVGAAKDAVDYLLNLGHRNISFISPPMTNTSTIEDRREGFARSFAEHGLVMDNNLWITNLISTNPKSRDKANLKADIENIKQFIMKNPQVTCIFAIEYNVATMALEAIKSLGKKVPEDISVLCFDCPSDYFGEHFFTCVRQNEEGIGAAAVELILRQLNVGQINDKVMLGTELIEGKSTALARR